MGVFDWNDFQLKVINSGDKYLILLVAVHSHPNQAPNRTVSVFNKTTLLDLSNSFLYSNQNRVISTQKR